MDMHEFYNGNAFDAYQYLGCHITANGAVFRTFAPTAQKIAVTGDFNQWSETFMNKVHDGNFWECEIADAKPNMKYKYRIYGQDGSFVDHCDPYGFGMELRPHFSSVIRDLTDYRFCDDEWMASRNDRKDKPLNIYEIHAGSWKTDPAKENGWFNYSELADRIIPYVKELGYNYIELLPICEHPCDNSWGYQNTGFYSPTSRYGTMNDLKQFIDKCHQDQIGVILDFVPVHFAIDDYALSNYDSTPLYEYPNPDLGVSEWGSKNFNHSRGEVRSFLQSNASYWLKEFHFDGLRMDAVSNLIYWQGDIKKGVNHNTVDFLKSMNSGLKSLYPQCMLIAEDSTAFPNVTESVENGGLGFDYKWNMGWMNDTLSYMSGNTLHRKKNPDKLSFSMMYYYDERFLLPFSHDEVVHGKMTILQKMNGKYENKFPQARALYMYMYAHPGKKLNFMGNEFGQIREWDEKREQDWDILKYPNHDLFQKFMKDLNHLYLEHSSLWTLDYDKNGFQWLNCNQKKCVYCFLRTDGTQKMIAIFNFSRKPVLYRLKIKNIEALRLLAASDHEKYGGNVSYGTNKIYHETSGIFLIRMGAFSAKYLLM